MTLIDFIGNVAGFCTTIAFVPQVLKVWRTRSTQDISVSMYAVFLLGLLLWLAYGWMLRAWPIIIANTFTIVLAGSVLVMKLRYDSAPPKSK
ncbi:MAG: SemiSWEET transporter [Pseudomonadota bacterium]